MDTKVQSAQAQRIRELNDQLRTTFFLRHGRVLITSGVDALDIQKKVCIIAKVKSFDDFDSGNDPHRQHDFGSFEIDGQTIFWKIDYYTPTLDGGSEDPADPDMTTRVLTIMLAEEY
jgi:hypothetical protein